MRPFSLGAPELDAAQCVPEPSVNSTARAPIFARPFSREFEKRYAEGDLLFVQEDGRAAGGNQNVVMNLPVLNYILKTQKRPDGSLRYQSVQDVLWGDQAIHFFGIMNNDMDTGSKWQRLLNVNVRGRSRVARPQQRTSALANSNVVKYYAWVI